MKLIDLIKDNSWLSVELVFSKIYPDQVSYMEDYEAVFNQLKKLEPETSGIYIIIDNVIDEFDNEEYVNVSGYEGLKVSATKKVNTESLALEFTPWAEWLGMSIDPGCLVSFSELEIICHCLHEMTFMGFSQEEIDSEWQRIKKAEDEIKQMTKEEKEKSSMTLEELKRKYKYLDK